MGARPPLRAALAQINTTVGDLVGNRTLAEAAYAQAIDSGAQLVLFPELTLAGYPPEDLLLKPSFLEDARASLERFAAQVTCGLVIIGFPEQTPAGIYNSAALISGGKVLDVYRKCALPNYGVFDEKRYFAPGQKCPIYEVGELRFALNICEDLFILDGIAARQARAGAPDLMLNLSASPYFAQKGPWREELLCERARSFGCPILYTNLVGGQDELVFDGQSVIIGRDGEVLARARQFAEDLLIMDLSLAKSSSSDAPLPEPQAETPPIGIVALAIETLPPTGPPALGRIAEPLSEDEEIYNALILGLRDYVTKNGFRGVVIGVSGGIDSALTAVIAADALGPEAVIGISMPSDYSSETSKAGAADLARNLGIEFHELSIAGLFDQMNATLAEPFNHAPADVTEENIQARLRGTLLMAFSNKLGHLVLATGNKSEVAVGYCTLYGDMVGGYSVLKDVLKTQVYRLARWRNAQSPDRPPIPQDTIQRPPSAELAPDQKDTDSLPPYEILDPIIRSLVEEETSSRELVAQGFDAEVVARIFRMIQGNEYKRRQAAPGIKITPRAFGKDRRYPLTNRYRPGAV